MCVLVKFSTKAELTLPESPLASLAERSVMSGISSKGVRGVFKV